MSEQTTDSSALLGCLRYHEKKARFWRKIASQMLTRQFYSKATYRARKHELFAAEIKHVGSIGDKPKATKQ